MGRYVRRTAVLAKTEVTAGVDAVPAPATNAVLVTDFSATPLDAQNIDRALLRGFFGGSQQLVGPASVKLQYGVELAGSGTAATPPAWGALLMACAMGEASLSAPSRVEYMPVSTALKSLTHYWYDDDVLHKVLGCMGNCNLTAKAGERPLLKFDFVGLDGGVTAVTNPATTLTAWRAPPPVTKANVIDITLGCTYAAGALSGGTVYNSTGVEMNFGNAVAFNPMLTTESVDITDRNLTGSFELELSPAQEVSLMAAVRANTLQSFGFTLGTTSGNKILIFSPNAQLLNPKKVDRNGLRLIGFDVRFPAVTGNDELRIVCV